MPDNQQKTSFMTREEIESIGFASVGENVLISRKTSIYTPEKMIIGNNVRIDDFSLLSGNIKLGNYVHIASYSSIFGSHGVSFEDYSCISIRTTILSASDDVSGNFFGNPTIPEELRQVSGGAVLLKKFSWVGAHCLILPDVTIEEGTAIGAMSMVARNTKPWTLYFGVPAVAVKVRDKGVLEKERDFLR